MGTVWVSRVIAGETIEECAIREVEEECGISGLSIISEAFSTFHLYNEKGKTIVKESVWYKMRSTDKSELVPQTEEDILEARWVATPVFGFNMRVDRVGRRATTAAPRTHPHLRPSARPPPPG